MSDRQFSHPNFGNEARVEVAGREVRLIFVAASEAKADSLADSILSQLKNGAINMTMMGKVTSVTES